MVGGFDVGLEMSGSPQAFTQMLDTMYHGGRVALLGLIPNGTAIDWDIKGIYGREIFETWYKMEAMIRSHLDISSVITHRFPFADFQKGFDAMLSGESGKVVLSF
jgi:threonine 3-dehydrogenase